MGNRLARSAAIALLLLAMTLLAACGGTGAADEPPLSSLGSSESVDAEDGEITIAIAGMVTPEEGFKYYEALCEYVGKKVGKEVHLIHKSDYATVSELLRTRKVDMAFVCSGPYVSAHDDYGLQLLVTPVVSGVQTYNSLIIVPVDSKAASLASLKGKTFAYTDPQSNTGRIVPQYMINALGDDPETYFKKTIFTYSHDNSIKAVADGTVDAAAVDSLIYDYKKATDPALVGKTRVLERSAAFGIPPVVVHPEMPEALKVQLRDAFIGAVNDPEGAEILKNMHIDGFDTIEDSAYDSIREMSKLLAECGIS